MTARPGRLHLIPVALGEVAAIPSLPPSTLGIIAALDYFIAENERSARRFLKSAGHPGPLQQLAIERFDKNGNRALASALLQPVLAGRDAGLLSEAGCPAVADPGAVVVATAHELGITVLPHIGPSAVLLALMASGCNGQCFAFHGYLPVDRGACSNAIVELERESRARDMTQIFIETPYRNDALLQTLLRTCAAGTRLCVASDLTLDTETIRCRTIAEWRTENITIGRQPSVFVLYAR